jgi:hypothetical protein
VHCLAPRLGQRPIWLRAAASVKREGELRVRRDCSRSTERVARTAAPEVNKRCWRKLARKLSRSGASAVQEQRKCVVSSTFPLSHRARPLLEGQSVAYRVGLASLLSGRLPVRSLLEPGAKGFDARMPLDLYAAGRGRPLPCLRSLTPVRL